MRYPEFLRADPIVAAAKRGFQDRVDVLEKDKGRKLTVDEVNSLPATDESWEKGE